MTTVALATARAAWGDELPDWVETLALECGRTSQARVAKALGRSGALVSQVLRRKYNADLKVIEERVRGIFLDARLDCPGMGEIPTHECREWRQKAREFVPGNPTRLRMFRACHKCPRNDKGAEV